VTAHPLPSRLSDGDGLVLVEVEGGAGLVLLRGLRRLDVFPPGDVGAERGLRILPRKA
jgi:hypothetical protein